MNKFIGIILLAFVYWLIGAILIIGVNAVLAFFFKSYVLLFIGIGSIALIVHAVLIGLTYQELKRFNK